ncbi:hypothetical protein Tco_1217082 [Tanacetum coccineum]
MVKIHTDKNVADLLTKDFDVRKSKKSVIFMMEKLFGMELELILLRALVDGKKLIVTEASVRRDLQLEDEDGVDCLPNSTIFEQLALMGSKTTAWNEFSSTMAYAIICLEINQKFNFSKYIFECMVKNLDNVSGEFLMYPRVGKGFSKRVTPLFPTMVVQNQAELGEGSAIPTDPHHTPTIIESSTQPQKTQKPRKPKRKDTQVPQPSGPTDIVADEAIHKELGNSLVRAVTTASSLEAEQDSGNITKTRSKSTPNESISLGTTPGSGPRCQETIGDTIAQTKFENVSKLSNDPLLTRDDNEMLDVNTLTGDEVFAEQDVATKDVNLTIDEVTLAQALAALKSAKPKVKGDVIDEPSVPVSTANASTKAKVQDKGKGKMVEPEKPLKKKDQISFDEETAKRLQAEFDKEARLAREKDEANVALTEEWDDI